MSSDPNPVVPVGALEPLGLRDLALAALGRLLEDRQPPESPEAALLIAQAGRIDWQIGLSAALDRLLQVPTVEDRPLVQAVERFDLSTPEILALSLALAVEESAAAGRAVAWLQRPVGGSRPTVGLIAAALEAADLDPGDAVRRLAGGAATEIGLLDRVNAVAPLPEQALAMPVPIALALRGLEAAWPGASGVDPGEPVEFPQRVLAQARAYASDLASAPDRCLVVRARDRRELDWVARAIADALDRRLLLFSGTPEPLRGVGAFCSIAGAVPAFRMDPEPGEQLDIPAPAGYRGPRLALAGPDGGLVNPQGSTLTWELPVPAPEERQGLWRRHLEDPELARSLALEHRHRAGRIDELARAARRFAGLSGRERVIQEDVRRAARDMEVGGLGALAQPVHQEILDEALVVPAPLRESLDTLESRCRQREGLGDGLGITIRARYQPGVRALFVGPSGTGKTLAASWLGTRLGLPVYRVDLASVTSKYIGETEKNLARLLARAEQAEVVLLFDEADSLFGKRTDIRDANDRYANQQTNYLLQRIETYDGIVVLTSNSRTRFDSAFTRRLDAVLEFPLPGPADRRRLWHVHLGAGHHLGGADINRLAASSDLCGGHVRNAVLAAAVLGRSEERPIRLDDVVRGLVGEYRKLGRQAPADLLATLGARLGGKP